MISFRDMSNGSEAKAIAQVENDAALPRVRVREDLNFTIQH